MFQVPQQIGQPGRMRTRSAGADAVASAVKAMGLAVQQLDGEKTKEAIPHEMAALQGLLQAQAEVRRRQVSQQANGASGNGYGRQGQDLSALFDKELQRQQRTNYETRSQIEERPDHQEEDSALDRIRDLARRQEDLSSRERELAQSQVSPEEKETPAREADAGTAGAARTSGEPRATARGLESVSRERVLAAERPERSGGRRPARSGPRLAEPGDRRDAGRGRSDAECCE